MNVKILRLTALALGCAGVLLILALALNSPATHNTGVEEVTLSRASGFYDAPFELELLGGGSIYYTLDSSDPDENSLPYTGPIPIGDASENENVYSAIEDVALDIGAAQLLTDAGFKLKFKYKTPQAPVDKATVVRAVRIDASGRRSAVTSGVFFVGFDQKKAYDGMNIVSIATDPKNLFDPKTGIYVLGDAFTNYLEDGRIPLASDQNYSFIPANYWYRGRAWEREASVCMFDSTRNLTLSGSFGIRMQGRGSRARLPKSLNLFARKDYDSPAFPGDALFGLDFDLTRLNLNSGSNNTNSLLKDFLVNERCQDLAYATREYEPCALFLDGEYWGVYWMTPRYKKDYMTGKFRVMADNVVIYYGFEANSTDNARQEDNLISGKVGRIEVGKPEDMDLYREMYDYVVNNDMNDPACYARVCEMVDMDSCVDYYATEIYLANTDWPRFNTALWRTREAEAGEYGDCRWRWLLFDVNGAMKPENSAMNMVKWTKGADRLFAALLGGEAFKSALYQKMVTLAQTCFEPTEVGRFIDDYEAFMAGQMQLKNLRFHNGKKAEDYFIKECEKTREFFQNRYDYIMGKYGDQG